MAVPGLVKDERANFIGDDKDERLGLVAVIERSPLADMMRRAESFPAYCPDLTLPVPYPFQMLYGALVRPVLSDGPSVVAFDVVAFTSASC